MQSTTVAPSENAFDVIEKEQEGIVLKLLHEINYLRDENKHLKQLLASSAVGENSSNCTSPLLSPHSLSISTLDTLPSPQSGYFYHPRSTSFSSSISSASSSSTSNGLNFPTSLANDTTTPRNLNSRRATITTMTNLKRTPVSSTANSSLLTIPHQGPKKRTCSSGSSTSSRPIIKPQKITTNAVHTPVFASDRSRGSGSISRSTSTSRSSSTPRSSAVSPSPTLSPVTSRTVDNRPVLFDTGIFSLSRKSNPFTDESKSAKSHKRSVSDNIVSSSSNAIEKLSLNNKDTANKTPSTGLNILKN